jgi:urea transport system ATP-binding protein
MLSVESIDLFYGAAQALRSVSLKAEIGRITCVLGRNGVGKSSLLRAICGHQQIAAGAIRWMGEDIKACPPTFARNEELAMSRKGARYSRCSPCGRI